MPPLLVNFSESAQDFARAVRFVVPALSFFAFVIAVATVGYMAMGWTPMDALYMVIITVFAVGYGEVLPVKSVAAHVWTMLVILSGWSAVVFTLGGVIKSVTEGELQRARLMVRKQRTMERLQNHVIICGYGRMGQALAAELRENAVPLVIVDYDEDRIAQIEGVGYLSMRGDATDEDVLERVGIERAMALATVLPQDALNVFITLTARNLAPGLRILARGEQLSTEKKLLHAGATEVILPANIGATRIAHSIVQPTVAGLMREIGGNLDLRGLGLEIDELQLHARAHLVGKTVGEVHRLSEGAVMVVAVRRGEQILRDDLENIALQHGDALDRDFAHASPARDHSTRRRTHRADVGRFSGDSCQEIGDEGDRRRGKQETRETRTRCRHIIKQIQELLSASICRRTGAGATGSTISPRRL